MPMLDKLTIDILLREPKATNLTTKQVRLIRAHSKYGNTVGICDVCSHLTTGVDFMLGGDAANFGQLARCRWCVKRIGKIGTMEAVATKLRRGSLRELLTTCLDEGPLLTRVLKALEEAPTWSQKHGRIFPSIDHVSAEEYAKRVSAPRLLSLPRFGRASLRALERSLMVAALSLNDVGGFCVYCRSGYAREHIHRDDDGVMLLPGQRLHAWEKHIDRSEETRRALSKLTGAFFGGRVEFTKRRKGVKYAGVRYDIPSDYPAEMGPSARARV